MPSLGKVPVGQEARAADETRAGLGAAQGMEPAVGVPVQVPGRVEVTEQGTVAGEGVGDGQRVWMVRAECLAQPLKRVLVEVARPR